MESGTQIVPVMVKCLQHRFDVIVFNSLGDGDLGVRHVDIVGDAFYWDVTQRSSTLCPHSADQPHAFVVALAQQEIVFVATRDGPIAIQTDGIVCTSREEVHKNVHRQPRA